MDESGTEPGKVPKPRYRWPWFVLAALLLAVALAFVWLNYEIQRTRRMRDQNFPPPNTTRT